MIKIIIDIYRHRELLVNLVIRDLKARYKVSVLGFLWSLIRPLFMMVIFTIVFSRIFRLDIRMDVPYSMFILSAILPWQFLTNAVNSGAHCLLSNQNLIKKVALPREIFPCVSVLAELINFILSLLVFIPFLILFHISISLWILWLIPVLIIHILFVLGLVFLVSSLNVFFRDTVSILDLFIMVWFYLSPIFYPVNLVQEHTSELVYNIYLLNPLVPILTGYRKAIIPDSFIADSGFGYYFPEWFAYFAISAIISLLIFIIGWLVFHYYDKKLVDNL